MVAVAAIFGIYYGSIAYDGAVAKSNAQQITKAAQQIQTAALIWRSENGAQYPGDGGKAAWYNALKTDYLQDAHNASKLIKPPFFYASIVQALAYV